MIAINKEQPTKKRWWRQKNVWIVLALLLLNVFAWYQISERKGREGFVVVEPILHPEIAEIRANWQSGDAVGETFSVTVTDQMAMETITWFLAPRSDLPFNTPQVFIHEDRIVGGGIVTLLGLKTPVLGTAEVWLENGKVTGEVASLQVSGTSAPQFIIDATDQAKSIYDDLSFPIEITHMELREGEVYIEGVYR